jgi:hypothetical protein
MITPEGTGGAKEIAMKLAITVLLATTFGTATAIAQTADQSTKPHVFLLTNPQGFGQAPSQFTFVDLPPAPSCPVSMRAEHLADGSMVKTSGAHPKGIGQWLHLSLASRDSRQIERATLTVHGFTPKGRVTQTLSVGNGTTDAVQTFNISFSESANWTALTNIWVAGMSAVERIDLISMDYNNGTSWKIAADSSCQVTPDPLMLITSR